METIRMCFVLISIFISLPVIRCGCPLSFSLKYHCSCYKIVNSPVTDRWSAKGECESLSAHLLFINSEEEKEALSLWYPYGQTFFWIGLNGLQFEEKQWDDGTLATYTNFQTDHTLTFDDNNDCYMIVPYGWIDIHPDSWLDDQCTDQNSYICEYEDTECSEQPSTPDGIGCPSGFGLSFDCSCYTIRPTAWKTREESKASCESLSSHLVFIESQEESDFLLLNLHSSYQYWIGINGLENEIKTWDDGTEVDYSNFGPLEAGSFNDATGCYRIVPGLTGQGMWYDTDCTNTYGYICEYDACKEEETTFSSTNGHTTPPHTTLQTTETTFPSTNGHTTSPLTTLQTTTNRPVKITTVQENFVETTSQAAETTFSSTNGHTTSSLTTLQTTTNRPVEITTVQENFVETTSQAEEFQDAGVIFGLSPNGILIPSDVTMTYELQQIRTITRCSVQCTRVNCQAFLFDESKQECNLATRPSLHGTLRQFTISRVLNCLNSTDKVICI